MPGCENLGTSLHNSGPSPHCIHLETFIADAASVVKCYAYTSLLSHAVSAQLACLEAPFCHEEFLAYIAEHNNDAGNASRGRDRMFAHNVQLKQVAQVEQYRSISAYEVSVETAQKRGYASNCFKVMLAKYDKLCSTDDQEHISGAEEFIRDIGSVAQTDVIALVRALHVCLARALCTGHVLSCAQLVIRQQLSAVLVS